MDESDTYETGDLVCWKDEPDYQGEVLSVRPDGRLLVYWYEMGTSANTFEGEIRRVNQEESR
jgi:hypothetical protein